MTVRVLAFARLRELLGFGSRDLELPQGATLGILWAALERERETVAPFRATTRFARNGTLADAGVRLEDGDEVALMPPVGGG